MASLNTPAEAAPEICQTGSETNSKATVEKLEVAYKRLAISQPPDKAPEMYYTSLEVNSQALTVEELENAYKRQSISQPPDQASEIYPKFLEVDSQANIKEFEDARKRLAILAIFGHPESVRDAEYDTSVNTFNSDIQGSASASPRSVIAGLSSLDDHNETVDEEARRLEGRATAWPDDGLLQSFRKEIEYKNKLTFLAVGSEFGTHEWVETQKKLDSELRYQSGWREDVERLAAELGL